MVTSADNWTSDLSCLKAVSTKDGRSKPLGTDIRFSITNKMKVYTDEKMLPWRFEGGELGVIDRY